MEKERRLIDVNALKEQAIPDYESGEMLIFASTVDEAPTVDAVSRGVHDQVRWERDIAIEQLESYGVSLGEKAEGKWIPVTERLPEDDRQVLACTKHGRAFSAHYDHKWKRWQVSHSVKITHWMPLPEPPKGE